MESPQEPKPDQPDFELSVGIQEFMNKHDPVRGAHKYRWSDFVVIEISENQEKIIHDPTDPQKWKDRIDSNEFKKTLDFTQTDDQKLKLSEIMTSDQIKEVESVYERARLQEKGLTYEIDLEYKEDKEERKRTHQILREQLKYFDSCTKDTKNSEKKSITAFYSRKQKKPNYGNEKWLSFVLMKKNNDTKNVLNRIASLLKKRDIDFTIAGNKDKRGVTCQKVTMPRVDANELMRLMFIPKWPYDEIQFSKPALATKPQKVGDLYGNFFRIALRFIDKPKEFMDQILVNVKKEGFINYFGQQRFGRSESSRTHEVGYNIIIREFKKAFEMILRQDNDFDDIKEAKKKYLEDGDHNQLLQILPRHAVVERNLLMGMGNTNSNNTNYQGAITNIPRLTRNLYIHAYQSYLWNKCVSIRIKNYGKQLILGDFVLKSKTLGNIQTGAPEGGNEVISDLKEDDSYERYNDDDFQIIDEKILELKEYTIENVYIPIVAADFKFLEGAVCHKIYKELLDEENICIEDFKALEGNFMVHGSWRQMIRMPEDLEWEYVSHYDKTGDIQDPYVSIKQSAENIEQINSNHLSKITEEVGSGGQDDSNKKKLEKYHTLFQEFSLKKSSYATMLFREILCVSSSLDVQQEINKIASEL